MLAITLMLEAFDLSNLQRYKPLWLGGFPVDLTALNVGVSLYANDVEWLQGTYGESWPDKLCDLVHEQIRRIVAQAKIAGFEAKLTADRLRERSER